MDDLTSQKRHKRINLTDPDARLMNGRQGIVAGYNAQAMVSPTETDGGATGMLVTAVDVVDAANDNALLVPMGEQAEETTGTRAQMTLADAGYFAASHLAECTRRGQQVVVSEARQRFLKDPYHKDQFTYNEQRQLYPESTDGRREDSGRGVRELRARWPGLHWGRWEGGGRSSVAAQGPYGRLRGLRCAGW